MNFNTIETIKMTVKQPTVEQLDSWMNGTNSSIYVHWIPQEMTKEIAEKYFYILGQVSRVEFVPYKNRNGRMMFVHFDAWNNLPESLKIRKNIVDASPEGYPLELQTTGIIGIVRTYKMICKINIRPIQKVDYNTHQLSDMFETLNKRVIEELTQMRKEMEQLRLENIELRRQYNLLFMTVENSI
jgi:hypothetical protein